MLIAHADHALVAAPDVRIAVLPVVGTAVVRVLEALHRNLIAVVDARHARVRHLPERRHEEARHAEIVLVVRQAGARLLDGRHAIVERLLAEHRDGALHIVAADEVHHRVEILTRVILAQALEAAQAHPGIRAAEQEVKEDLAERVVHGRVHLLAAEVLARHAVGNLVRSILPDLADHDGIGICLLELREEGLREGRRQFVDDIEAPARDALLHPVVHDAVLVVDDEVHVRWRRLFDVRQRGEIPPALVLVREVAEVVPLVVGRIRRLERANRIVLALAVEVAAVAARMAEDTVEDDADALRLRRVDEMAEVLIRAENRVDLVVITRVVVVIALRLKDRVQVDDRDAEVLEVVELLLEALEIAAAEIGGNDLLRVGVLVVARIILPAGMEDRALLLDDGVSLAREAVREDLVHDGVLEPVRRLGPLVEHRDLERRRHMVVERAHAAELFRIVAVVPGAILHRDDEVIPDEASLFWQRQPAAVEMFLLEWVILRLQRDEMLARLVLPAAQDDLTDPLFRAQAQAHPDFRSRFCRPDGRSVVDILRVMPDLILCQHEYSSFQKKGGIICRPPSHLLILYFFMGSL